MSNIVKKRATLLLIEEELELYNNQKFCNIRKKKIYNVDDSNDDKDDDSDNDNDDGEFDVRKFHSVRKFQGSCTHYLEFKVQYTKRNCGGFPQGVKL